MNRRSVLRTAALLAAGSAAGCLAGGSGDGPDSTTTTTTTRTTTPDPTTTTTDESGPAVFETLTVGSREGVLDPGNNKPHEVTVVNAASEERTIRVRVRRSGDDPMLRAESRSFPADGRLRVELAKPGEYAVDVFVDDEEVGGVDVERSWFDCNSSRTTVTVAGDGEVETETISTTMACGASVRDHAFEVTDGRCRTDGEPEEASVTFGDGALELSGLLVVPSPDYGAEVASVEWERVDGGPGLVVTVATTEAGQGGGGVQCVGALDYEATLDVDGELPRRVTVQHRSADGTREVATATRDAESGDD